MYTHITHEFTYMGNAIYTNICMDGYILLYNNYVIHIECIITRSIIKVSYGCINQVMLILRNAAYRSMKY